MTEVIPDQGWAWVVLAGTFLSNMICALYTLTGVFYVIFLEVFGESSTVTAWLVGVHSTLVSLVGPISSILMNVHGPRFTFVIGGTVAFLGFFISYFVTSFVMLYISYGLLAGAGIGISYSCSITISNLYFIKYRLFAQGISVAGIAFGSVVLVPVVRICTNYYGWRGTMLVLAALSTHYFVTACVILPRKKQNFEIDLHYRGGSHDKEKSEYELNTCSNNNVSKCDISANASDTNGETIAPPANELRKSGNKCQAFDCDIFKNLDFVGYCIALVFINAAIAAYLTFLPALAMDHGTQALPAANLIAWGSVVGIPARIGIGTIANYFSMHEYLWNLILCSISSVLLFLVPYFTQWYSGQLTIVMLFGAFGICSYVLIPATCIAILGIEKLGSAVGTTSFMCGIGFLIGPLTGGSAYLLAGVIMGLLFINKKIQELNTKQFRR